jgi:shikimate 5-dehydrogenase
MCYGENGTVKCFIQFDTTVPYVDKVKSVKNTGFPNQGERYGAKYENGVAYLLSYTVSVEQMWTQKFLMPDGNTSFGRF